MSNTFFYHKFAKLESNYREKNGKNSNTWRINNMIFLKMWVNKEIKEEIVKYSQKIKKHATLYNLWDTTHAVLRGKFIVIQAYL